jgi:hypothetical protein
MKKHIDLKDIFSAYNPNVEYLGKRRAIVEISGIWNYSNIITVLPSGARLIGRPKYNESESITTVFDVLLNGASVPFLIQQQNKSLIHN